MKSILVHCHIYNVQFWEELKECIHNVEQYPMDLYVTMVENHEDIQDDILKNFPHAKVQIVEGRGFDVGPFIHVLNQVNLDHYSYIIKLHTKRDLPKEGIGFRGMYWSEWRNNLLKPFRSKDMVCRYIENLEKSPTVGMTAYYKLFINNTFDKNFDKNTYKSFKLFLHNNGLKNIPFQYVAGTMFIARASLFKYIQDMKFSLKDFSPSNRKEKGDLAHVFERFLGYMIYRQGFIISDGAVSTRKQQLYHQKIYLENLLTAVVRLFWQKKVTSSGKLLIKILKIPVYRRKHVSTD